MCTRESGRARRAAEAEEGLLLLDYTVRMRLRNGFVADILTSVDAIDPYVWATRARSEVMLRRNEARTSGRHVSAQLRSVRVLGPRAAHEHDYRWVDVLNLLHRMQVQHLIADRLLQIAEDPAAIADLVERARADAHAEISQTLRGGVSPAGSLQPDDEALVAERLELLTSVDLPALARAALQLTSPCATASRRKPFARSKFT